MAEELLEVMEQAIEVYGEACRLGASIGIAHYPDHGRNLSELMRRADQAMYEAKRLGRNRYVRAPAA